MYLKLRSGIAANFCFSTSSLSVELWQKTLDLSSSRTDCTDLHPHPDLRQRLFLPLWLSFGQFVTVPSSAETTRGVRQKTLGYRAASSCRPPGCPAPSPAVADWRLSSSSIAGCHLRTVKKTKKKNRRRLPAPAVRWPCRWAIVNRGL